MRCHRLSCVKSLKLRKLSTQWQLESRQICTFININTRTRKGTSLPVISVNSKSHQTKQCFNHCFSFISMFKAIEILINPNCFRIIRMWRFTSVRINSSKFGSIRIHYSHVFVIEKSCALLKFALFAFTT